MTKQKPQPQGPSRDSDPSEPEKKVTASDSTSKEETRSWSTLSVQHDQDANAEGTFQLRVGPRTPASTKGSLGHDAAQGSKVSGPENSDSKSHLVSHTLFSEMAPTTYPRTIGEKDCDLRNKPPDNKSPDGTTKCCCQRHMRIEFV